MSQIEVEGDSMPSETEKKSKKSEKNKIKMEGDSMPLEIEKKSKNSKKNKTLVLQEIDNGGSCLKAAGDLSNDKKLKLVVNEDENEDEDEDEKGKGNDGNLAKKVNKKRKHEVTVNESKSKAISKKVRFLDHVETYSSSDTENEKPKTEEDNLKRGKKFTKPKAEEDNLVRGKRFTPEEDELIKDAVLQYVKAYDLGENGLDMVLNRYSYPGMKSCWKKIGTCIPYRPHTAIYYRAHTIFERGERRKWTKEETEFLQECYEKYGNNWKLVAKALGKNRVHVKDKWRRIKLTNRKLGKWSQEEYQSLYDLVNLNLQTKVVAQEKSSQHGMLRDNIPWGAISDKLTTRNDSTCCLKWYGQLTSSLVAEGKWSNADDYRLIRALYDLDASCVEDVDWDKVLEHRPGDICRKRWDQMVLHIGHHGSQPFPEQVEILSQRYCPDLAETREAWDSKPLVQ